MSAGVDPISASPAPRAWIYRPWLDLLVGCGGWSAPLLLVAFWLTPSNNRAWVDAFYLLAIVFNYPHFMATVYRAYHTRADFEKHKIVTLHITLLVVLTGVLLHASPRLLPWIFTLYICWSPWHYTGQNYGLLMMFARRGGAQVSIVERRWMRAAFVASYLMLLASFETGGSSDPLILSLGLPARFTIPARLVLGAAFAVFTAIAFQRLVRRTSLRAMIAPLTLALTQFLWFVMPTLLELHAAYHIPQTRYSSGILAVMHSAQYVWITSYYQQREARTAGQTNWRMPAYFVTLLAGGIALFIPGPWIVSRIFHFDFTTSFLIFTSLVNIHHFILDGAIWKLRDSRIASLLIDRSEKTDAKASIGVVTAPPTRSLAARIFSTPAFRVGVVALLFLWGGMDQIHFALRTDESSLASLLRAARMDPYDSAVQAEIGVAAGKAGHQDEELAAFQQAAEVSPDNAAIQSIFARALIENRRYDDAYRQYRTMLARFPSDPDALVNYGVLAAQLGHPEEAMDAWEKAAAAAPDQPNAHLYLAQAFDQNHEPAAAIPHWQAFLRFAGAHSDDPAARPSERISATIRLADDEVSAGGIERPREDYLKAIELTTNTGDSRLASVALGHLADLQEKTGDAQSAAESYQRALALDEKGNDPSGEASDWFNYGQFLRRHKVPEDLVYACLLRADNLLSTAASPDLATVRTARLQLESSLGKQAVASQKNLSTLLARAAGLPASSF